MQAIWRNTNNSFGWPSIFLHWLSALIVIFLLIEGLYMVTLTYYDALYHTLPQWHKLAGIGLFLLTIVRMIWVAINKSPVLLTTQTWQRLAAHVVHYLFYVTITIMIITGYFITTAEGHGIALFFGAEIPAITILSPELASLLGEIHEVTAFTLIALIFLHAAAAVQHHFYYHDKTLVRMLKPSKD